MGRQDHQRGGTHALGHQDQPGVRITRTQQPNHDPDIAGEAVVPGHRPRVAVAPKPRRSGENTAIPAAANVGCLDTPMRRGYHSCRAAPARWRRGGPSGSHSLYGSRVPSGITNEAAVSIGFSTTGPGGASLGDASGQQQHCQQGKLPTTDHRIMVESIRRIAIITPLPRPDRGSTCRKAPPEPLHPNRQALR